MIDPSSLYSLNYATVATTPPFYFPYLMIDLLVFFLLFHIYEFCGEGAPFVCE